MEVTLDASSTWSVRVISSSVSRYTRICLMPNHYHLLLHCPTGGLSDFMHRLGSIYTRALNDDMCSDGAIFRGRFRSILCDQPDYIDNVGRYIHRNPMELQRGQPLSAWKWSSYRAYIGLDQRPNWLTTTVLLGWHGGRNGLREFVEGEIQATSAIVDVDTWRWAISTAIGCNSTTPAQPHTRHCRPWGRPDQAGSLGHHRFSQQQSSQQCSQPIENKDVGVPRVESDR